MSETIEAEVVGIGVSAAPRDGRCFFRVCFFLKKTVFFSEKNTEGKKHVFYWKICFFRIS